MQLRRRLGSLGVVATSLTVAAVVMAACSSSPSTTSPSGTPSGGTKQAGGVATWAEPPGSPPNYIFPVMPIKYASVGNISQFQYLMFRPLYFFGLTTSNSPVLNSDLSLASEPTYANNGTQAVVNLKNYSWSNGEAVTAQDVVFFMNLLHAQKANWYAYVPGTLPDNVTNITVNSPTQLTFTFDKSYNSFWMTYNEFSQITPLPKAWDLKADGGAPGSGGCFNAAYGSADTACTAVYNYLNGKASNISGYASDPLWQTVDGPWKLSAFDSTGNVTMVPNTSYSGPVKATLAQFKEVPYTTESAELNSLIGNSLDVGYVPLTSITQSTSNPEVAGPNFSRLTANYYMNPWVLFGYNYFPLNFNTSANNGATAAIFKQLYFRQALQMLEDQPTYISKFLHGYAVPTYGPIPVIPANPYVTSTEKSNPYPYDPTKAKNLLSSHGWKINAGGTDTCTNAGSGPNQCGAGIPAGTPLSFHLEQSSGITWQIQVVDAEKSSWSSAGINVSTSTATFNTVLGNATPCTPGPAAPGRASGGAAAGSTPPTSTRPARPSSPPGRGRTTGATPTRRPTTSSSRPTRRTSRWPSTRTTSPSSSRPSGSPTPTTR
jgi:peptide/nickel transport system substrate-binding protein